MAFNVLLVAIVQLNYFIDTFSVLLMMYVLISITVRIDSNCTLADIIVMDY